jgi:hypothetical protein
MLVRLCDGDVTIPAGRILRDHALVIADRAAAAQLETNAASTSVLFENR